MPSALDRGLCGLSPL